MAATISGLEESYGVEEKQETDRISIDANAEDAKTARRVHGLIHNLTPDTPSPTDKSLNKRAAPIDVEALTAQNERLKDYYSDLALDKAALEDLEADLTSPNPPSSFQFPNLAWEAVKAGLAKENHTNKQLNGHIKEAEKHQKDIDLLLDFSSELTGMKEDQTEMTEKMKTVLGELKERGIELWKGEDQALTKEKISELKSLTSAQVDKLRSNLQILFTTKIQVLIQSIGAIMETLKDIIRNNTKLINAANRLPGH